jgi:hypothetical protein
MLNTREIRREFFNCTKTMRAGSYGRQVVPRSMAAEFKPTLLKKRVGGKKKVVEFRPAT